MELLLEIILDVILDGTFEILTERKLPMVLRLLVGLVLGFIYGGLAGVGISLMVSGITKGDMGLILCGAVIVGIVAVFGILIVKKLKNR